MDIYTELLARLRNPDVRRALVPNYEGFYSLGLSRNPQGPDGIGITISVPQGARITAPETITLSGRKFPIKVVEDRVSISPFR